MWLACQRASWEPRLPMRMGLRGLLCSELIFLTRIRDAKCDGSDSCHQCGGMEAGPSSLGGMIRLGRWSGGVSGYGWYRRSGLD